MKSYLGATYVLFIPFLMCVGRRMVKLGGSGCVVIGEFHRSVLQAMEQLLKQIQECCPSSQKPSIE